MNLPTFDGHKLIVTAPPRVASKRQKEGGTASPTPADQLNADANNAVTNDAATITAVVNADDHSTNMETEKYRTLYIKGKKSNIVSIATDKPTALKRELDSAYGPFADFERHYKNLCLRITFVCSFVC